MILLLIIISMIISFTVINNQTVTNFRSFFMEDNMVYNCEEIDATFFYQRDFNNTMIMKATVNDNSKYLKLEISYSSIAFILTDKYGVNDTLKGNITVKDLNVNSSENYFNFKVDNDTIFESLYDKALTFKRRKISAMDIKDHSYKYNSYFKDERFILIYKYNYAKLRIDPKSENDLPIYCYLYYEDNRNFAAYEDRKYEKFPSNSKFLFSGTFDENVNQPTFTITKDELFNNTITSFTVTFENRITNLSSSIDDWYNSI